MEKFSDDWDTTGGTCMGPSLQELLSSRRMDLEREMHMGSKKIAFLPEGGENFMKAGSKTYDWIADNGPIIKNAPGDYFNEGESSSFKKIDYGNPQIEMKKTVTKIFR
jgi:hypothetical protein